MIPFLRHHFHSVALAAAACVFTAATPAATVEATLSPRTATEGDMVQYQIQVTDSSGNDLEAPDISVDGLDIKYLGPSTSRRMEFVNGRITQSNTTTMIYQVVASTVGTFTIPAVTVNVGGQQLQTQSVALRVEKNTGAVSDGQNGKIAFSEIDPFKRQLYVGEIVPVEINFYLDARVNAELEQMPDFAGDGFTKQKMGEPRQQRAKKDGQEWKVVTFRTLITPSKAGKLTLGPTDVPFVAQVPRQRGRSRDPFGSFFDDPFFDGAFGERKRYNARAPAVELEVKPLPSAGRPADFSGGIGQFTFTAAGKPDRAKVGDPITMTLTISGKGNFDRIQAPVLVDANGWHAYPASKAFAPAANSELEGTQTFEMPVTAEKTHQRMPQFRFTYFDPEDGKYVSLKSDPQPLTVEGAPARPEPSVAPAAPGSEAPAPEKIADDAPPTDTSGTYRGLAYEQGKLVDEFAPFYRNREFLLGQIIPLATLLVLIVMRIARRAPDPSREASWRRERDRLRHALRAEKEAAAFYETAARTVQMQTAVHAGIDPAGIDAAAVRTYRGLDDDTAKGVEEIFNARAELLYAGVGSAPRTVSSADRERVLATVDRILT